MKKYEQYSKMSRRSRYNKEIYPTLPKILKYVDSFHIERRLRKNSQLSDANPFVLLTYMIILDEEANGERTNEEV